MFVVHSSEGVSLPSLLLQLLLGPGSGGAAIPVNAQPALAGAGDEKSWPTGLRYMGFGTWAGDGKS